MRLYRQNFRDRRTGKKRQATKWYLQFRDPSGVVRRIPGFSDQAATRSLGRGIQRLLDLRGQEPPDAELSRWIENLPARIQERLAELHLIDEKRLTGAKPLTKHLEDFRESLLPGRAPRHVEQTVARVKCVIEGCGFKFWQDIRPDAVDAFLRKLRAGEEGVSLQTSNYYLGAVRQFCRWMVAHGRASESPLTVLRPLNAALDRRKIRRAFTEKELRSLLRAAEKGPVLCAMTGKERALLYRLAVETGLRAGELRSLTGASFDLKATSPTVTVEAAYSKRRRKDVLPLRADTARLLRAWLRTRLPSSRAFNLPTQNPLREALQTDIKAAKIKGLDDPKRPLDFHSLRHTFLTNLARAGVHPKTAQALARHSTISLTLDRYTHVSLGDEVRAVEALPDLSGSPGPKLKPTGTEGGMGAGSLPSCLPSNAAASCNSMPPGAASRGQEEGSWHARRDSNPRLSDPKSDALSS